MSAYNTVVHVGYSLFRKCPKSGWKIDTRTLIDHEIVLITGGQGKLELKNSVCNLEKGTLLYLYPGVEHSMYSCNDNPMSFYGIHFSYVTMKYFNSQWDCEERCEVLPLKIHSAVSTYERTEELFKKLNKYWNEKSLGFEMICRSTLMEILYTVMQHTEVNFSSRRKIETLLAYINKNFHEKLTIQTLAKVMNQSPDYLAAQFKSITGFTIVQYINKCRIDQAKIMLLNDEMRIKDVAAEVGFSDEFYFSKTFKKYEGISPVHFIKNMR